MRNNIVEECDMGYYVSINEMQLLTSGVETDTIHVNERLVLRYVIGNKGDEDVTDVPVGYQYTDSVGTVLAEGCDKYDIPVGSTREHFYDASFGNPGTLTLTLYGDPSFPIAGLSGRGSGDTASTTLSVITR